MSIEGTLGNTKLAIVMLINKNLEIPYSMSSAGDLEAGSDRLSEVAVRELMTVSPLTVEQDTSVGSAATLMQKHSISCLPVSSGGQLIGLVTEADFVRMVVAGTAKPGDAIASVMTTSPLFVSPEQSVLDVLTLMTRHRISHMPVVNSIDKQLVGIVTQTDVIKHQIASSVFMVGDIARMRSSEAISEVLIQLPRLLCSLVDGGSTAYEAGRVMTSITGAVTRRLLELAEEQLGEPPVPYVWLACGSQGRQEQTGTTDQDNCVMLDDSFEENAHGDYFKALTEFVCHGLHQAGYVYCPGDMMAMNEKWRQPCHIWRAYFSHWIGKPGEEAQMLASVMFDLRPIFGARELFEPLRDEVLKLARQNSIFIAHMTANSLTHRPPLGLFNRFKNSVSNVPKGNLDLKHQGVVPIVDLARVYALSAGITTVNTLDRLNSSADERASVESGVLSPSGIASLAEAYETISMIRLRHQVRQIKQLSQPDNFVELAALTKNTRERLRSAMKTIKNIQSTLSSRVAVVGR